MDEIKFTKKLSTKYLLLKNNDQIQISLWLKNLLDILTD